MSIFRWFSAPYPRPGTGNKAFEQFQGLPAHSPIGPALAVQSSLALFPASDQIVIMGNAPQAGLGGLVNGQLILQGLVDKK